MATTNRISRITVRGFKSICTEQHIGIIPLTILAGANRSGKSSMLQPILLLKQTLDAPSDTGALLLDGPNARFTLTDQILNRVLGKKGPREFSVCVALLEDESLELVFQEEAGSGFEISHMVYAIGAEKITIK